GRVGLLCSGAGGGEVDGELLRPPRGLFDPCAEHLRIDRVVALGAGEVPGMHALEDAGRPPEGEGDIELEIADGALRARRVALHERVPVDEACTGGRGARGARGVLPRIGPGGPEGRAIAGGAARRAE